ncbi:hypothetical protein [Mesorhizobium sp.]|uniref:hypothetical protein n=1 Tax=Mesorhizobium sp. TaxID=1871066 RepID=UPI0025F7841A|nr:hypothetical protein [Mesorhizobium sp.]
MQGTQQLRPGPTVIGAGIGHEWTDDGRIQCRSVELIAGFQNAHEPAEAALRVYLDKRLVLTAVKIKLSHIVRRLRDRVIAKAATAELRQEECRDALEIFGGERPYRAMIGN